MYIYIYILDERVPLRVRLEETEPNEPQEVWGGTLKRQATEVDVELKQQFETFREREKLVQADPSHPEAQVPQTPARCPTSHPFFGWEGSPTPK